MGPVTNLQDRVVRAARSTSSAPKAMAATLALVTTPLAAVAAGLVVAVVLAATAAAPARAQITPEVVEFSETRGFRDTGFDLTLSSPDPAATIRYSVNGAAPTPDSGTVYSGPISISETSYVQAVAVVDGVASDRVVHTYVFPADIAAASYMWSRVTGDATWGPQLQDSLRSLPVVSIVTGRAMSTTEQEASFEIFDEASGIDEQAIAGARNFGNASLRLPNSSIRVYFRSEYGPGRLSADLFDGHEFGVEPATRFDKLDLRTSHDTLTAGGFHLYTRWLDTMMTSGGRLTPHSRPVFVYLDGSFHGIAQLRESFDDNFVEQYLGNDAEYLFAIWKDNDVIAPLRFQIVDGDPAEWDALKASTTSSYADFVATIGDPNALYDWVIHHSYGYHEGEWDVAGNTERGFSFNINDADKLFLFKSTGRIANVPAGFFQNLTRLEDPQFFRDFGDRVECTTTQGLLEPSAASAHWDRLVADVAPGIVADSARWGSRRSHDPAYWQAGVDERAADDWIPALAEVVVTNFRDNDYYPEIDGVDVSVSAGRVTMTPRGAATTIYYTLDRTDPANPDATVAPSAIRYTGPFDLAPGAATIRARAHDSTQPDELDRWSASCPVQAIGSAAGGAGVAESPIQFSEIHYNPEGAGGAEFIELRNDSDTVTVDLGDLRIEDGVSFYAFGTGDLLGPGEFVVLADDPTLFEATHGFAPDGVFHRSLSNGGETITLRSDRGHIYDQVSYLDAGDWPAAADGLGPSLERRTDAVDNGQGGAWQASSEPGGSPGSANSTGLLVGDADCDDEVDSGDILVVLAGRVDGSDSVSNCGSPDAGRLGAVTRGDIDSDGSVSLIDAWLIARCVHTDLDRCA